MEKIIIAYAINIVLKSAAGYAGNLDAMKPAADAYIKAHVPAIADPALEQVANDALDDLTLLLKDTTDLNTVLTDAATGDWADAFSALEALAQKIFINPTPSQVKLLAALKAA